LKKVLVHFPNARVKQLDKLVEQKQFPNRNEAIREAVRLFVIDSANVHDPILHRICNLWHQWNQRKLTANDAMLSMHKFILEVGC